MEASDVPAAAGLLRDALARRYVLEREVGRGGMATVYLGRDVKHGRAVAVKVLHAELAAAVGPERFLREIELTASLQHPHILPLFDSGATNGVLWYVMPFIEGETLRARLERERQLPVPVAERIAREVADALAYAHARGVVHRDIKPENILLQDGHALVADFGIALAAQRANGARLTGTGLMLGTPHYMAPEQGAGDGVVDARADVYALGAVLYEMLAGEPPYTGPTAQVVMARALTERPRALTTTRPTVPARLAAIVDTALAKVPADRFESAAAMRDALSRGDRPSVARALVRGAALGPWRSRVALVGGAALLAGAALGVAGALAMRDDAPARAARRPVQFVLEPDSGLLARTAPALSPDGRTIVYGMEGPDGTLRLYARPLDSLEARPIPESDDAEMPFFSPDGQWVGFVRGNDVYLVSVDGQQARHVARVPAAYSVTQVSWMRGDTLAIATGSPVVLAVPAAGGETTELWRTDTFVPIAAASPLPDGRMLLTMAANSTGVPGGWLLGILDRDTKRVTPLGEGIGGRWADGEVV